MESTGESVQMAARRLRYAWFDSGLKWFGDGEGKWCWGDYYPQSPGLKNGKAEAISVMPAIL